MRKFFRKRNIIITSFFLLFSLILYWAYDAFCGRQRFRTMQDTIYSLQDVNLKGLRELKASGGNQPRMPYLSWKLSHIKDNKIVLNLKYEVNRYIKGYPTTYLAYHHEKPDIRH